MTKKRRRNWSYNAGERGRNWVRAFRQSRDGKLYVEWREDGRRRALLLRGVTTEDEAKAKADELAARFTELEASEASRLSLAELLDRYQQEVTPTKGESKQRHDRRAVRLWTAFFGAQPEVARQMTRRPDRLDRIDWDRFVAMRRGGLVPGWPEPVRDGQVQYDLKFLIAVLNWAVGATLIASSPWSTDVRRIQRWLMPRELNPHRPSMSDEIREELIAHAPGWQFGAMLRLERETKRRNNAIRQLTWSDVDLVERTVLWRG